MYRWLRDDGLPEGFQVLCLSCNDSKGTGERCTLAHIEGKKRCYAYNEIKLLESDMIGSEGEITAIDRGGVRRAEG
jgi:hypothetical protein